jgi:hypothetical protein
MPRLTSPSGAVVDVSDETAELLGPGYTPVEDDKKDEKKAPAAKKSAASSSKTDEDKK